MNDHHHSMGAATRRFLVLLTALSKISIDDVDEEADIPYCFFANYDHSHHSTLWLDQSLTLGTLLQPHARSKVPTSSPYRQSGNQRRRGPDHSRLEIAEMEHMAEAAEVEA
jgi:hypothetical protein